jgi:hypothetical protein
MRTLGVLICIFIIPTLIAQEPVRPEKYMSLSFGAGIPKGNLASDNDIFKSGYASGGFMAEYSGAYFFRKHIGIGGSFQFISNYTDQQKIQDNLESIVPESVQVNVPYVADIGKWDIVSLTLGPQATMQAGVFHFDLYVKTGIYVVSPPLMKLTAIINSNDAYYCSLDSKLGQPGLSSGINIRIDLNEYTGIKLSGEYEFSRARGTIQERYETQSGTEKWNYDYSANIHLINLGIGLIYRM